MPTVDLRSDTVTRPTAAMKSAMIEAPVGDDVLGDDPTVQQLEAVVANLSGHEAALFFPSGTMANQTAIATHCERGDAILVEEEAHVIYYEVAAPAVIAGVLTWTLPSDRGTIDPDVVCRRVLSADLHRPATTLLCLENTHNRHGGAIVKPEVLAEYRSIADNHGMKMHLDGARAWNAAVALGVPLKELTSAFDSVSLCLSKGMGTPVGSVLTGSQSFIDKARRWRKRLGGGMRQSGMLAAAGLYAIENNFNRLSEDHDRAKRLAEGIQGAQKPETNIVLIDTIRPAADVCADLHALGVWCFPVAERRLRLVIHLQITDADVDQTIAAFGSVPS
jgi:threonine aldolase